MSAPLKGSWDVDRGQWSAVAYTDPHATVRGERLSYEHGVLRWVFTTSRSQADGGAQFGQGEILSVHPSGDWGTIEGILEANVGDSAFQEVLRQMEPWGGELEPFLWGGATAFHILRTYDYSPEGGRLVQVGLLEALRLIGRLPELVFVDLTTFTDPALQPFPIFEGPPDANHEGFTFPPMDFPWDWKKKFEFAEGEERIVTGPLDGWGFAPLTLDPSCTVAAALGPDMHEI